MGNTRLQLSENCPDHPGIPITNSNFRFVQQRKLNLLTETLISPEEGGSTNAAPRPPTANLRRCLRVKFQYRLICVLETLPINTEYLETSVFELF